MLVGGERREDAADLIAGAGVEGVEPLLSGCGEADGALATVGAGGLTADEPGGGEAGEDSAEVAHVHAEFGGNLGCGGLGAVGEFIEDAGFGEGVGAFEEMLVEGPEVAGVEAVEAADRGDGIGVHDLSSILDIVL